MDKDLIKLLESSGFTEKEAQVYLALLELSQGNVTQISKITGLKRPIIYVILEGLIKRGYASEIPERKINTYQAMDPSVILRQLQSTTKNFSEMLPMFRTLHNQGKGRPKITYHETSEGIWKVWDEMSGVDEVIFISSYERIEQHFPGSIEMWIKTHNKKLHPIGNRHLIPNKKVDLDFAKNFNIVNEQVRCLDDFRDIKMDFSIFGNKVAITSLEEKPFIVVIESEDLANSMRPIFEIAWEKGREINIGDKNIDRPAEIRRGRTNLA